MGFNSQFYVRRARRCGSHREFAHRRDFRLIGVPWPTPETPPCPFQKRFPSQLVRDDAFYMSLAYNQAIDAWREDEVPIGAVIVSAGEVIGSAHNRVEGSQDPTAHAEMLAITQAASRLGDWRLEGATVYVTKEPCPMCSGRPGHVAREAGVLRRPRPEDGLPGRRREPERPAPVQPPF